MSHQVESTSDVDVQTPHGYGSAPGSSIVESFMTWFRPGSGTMPINAPQVVLPVDIAVSPSGKVAMASPGTSFLTSVSTLAVSSFPYPDSPLTMPLGPSGEVVAVAFVSDDRLLAQTREPARLWIVDLTNPNAAPSSVVLSNVSRADTGHDIFHAQAGGFVACASCHPEGGDDGHIWLLSNNARRTPSLRGTIAGTAPYHWPGDQADIPALVNDVYTKRMSGAQLDDSQMHALQHWVEGIPAPVVPSWVEAASAQRGQAIFERSDVGCASCHAGPKHTNNATLDVGTGGPFQVPPLLGVGWRTPLLHDGCAATIADRFGHCATPGHGDISKLAPQDVTDLGMYLESL
jgi:hypothetical protein